MPIAAIKAALTMIVIRLALPSGIFTSATQHVIAALHRHVRNVPRSPMTINLLMRERHLRLVSVARYDRVVEEAAPGGRLNVCLWRANEFG